MTGDFGSIHFGVDSVRLTTAELLKNYFFSREDIAQYNKDWVEVFEKDNDIRAYWNQEFETGRVTRSLIDVFFDSYFQLFVQDSKYKVTTEDKISYGRLEHLAKSYQDFVKNYCQGNKQIVLAPMAQYANRFREIFDPECINRQMPKRKGIERINVIIFGLKNTTLIPYVLYLACNVTDAAEFDKMMGILESYIMRRLIIRATTKNYNNLFVSLILNQIKSTEELLTALKRIGDGTTYVPSDAEMLDGFRESKLTNLQAKGVIYFIEAGARPDQSSTALLGFKQYSLEHLMPRKWRNHWAACGSQELARARDQKLQTLGNFAIITQILNTSISDADWNTKKLGKKDNPGLISCAAGLLTMENVLPKDNWDEECIEERANWLCEKGKELWSDIAPAISDGSVSAKGTTQAANTAELRKRYWTYALPLIKTANIYRASFSNCNPINSNTLSGSFGLSGFRVDCIANFDVARIDFYLGNNDKEKNKQAFDVLYSHKEEIEGKLGVQLSWSRADDNVASWIVLHQHGVSLGNEKDWPQMAAFHAEWSHKICDTMLPYLVEDNPIETRQLTLASWTREWAGSNKSIVFDAWNSSRAYTRFTTSAMTEILPELKNAPSSWHTDTHYFYEIYIMSSQKLLVQMAINSKNITEEFRTICDRIQEFYPYGKKEDWYYRIPFKTTPVKTESITKEELFQYLDSSLEQIHVFEKDLKEKLSIE